MRRGLSLSGLSGQESKSPFLRLSYWTGSTPYQVTHLKLKMLGSERKKREDIVLCSVTRREWLLSSVLAIRCGPMSWGERSGYPDHRVGTQESQLIKAPCQPGMHYIETGKLLKALQSWSMMFYGAPWPAECNLKKISRKMKRGDNPIKAGQPSPKLEQVLQYPCHYCMCGPPQGLRYQRQSLPAGW